MRDFRKLRMWQNAISFAVDIYELTKLFPVYEKYGLADQMRRSSVSIASNIAEGAGRRSNKEYMHFLFIGVGSAFEIETQLLIAMRVNYLSGKVYDEFCEKLLIIEKQLNELISVVGGYKNAKTSS